ncbi:hypothetical protein [Treponema sp. R6D11]
MMKKVWLVLLAMVLVFGLAVVGCSSGSSSSGDGEEETLVEKVVFDLATDAGIQALEEGDLDFSDEDANNPIKPLVKSGSLTGTGDSKHLEFFKAVTIDGKIALHYKTLANWGPGIDMPNKAFGYRVGDNIKITGEIVAIPSGSTFQLNKYVNSENATIGGKVTKITEVGAFSYDITLTDDDIDQVTKGASGGGPAGIRIEARSGSGTSSNIEVKITNITITGLRPSKIVTLSAPVPVLVGNRLEWEAVDGAVGYAIYKDDDEDPFTTVTGTNVNLGTLPVGTYIITVVAKGVPGTSLDSPKSAAVSYTKEAGPALPAGYFDLGASDNATWYTNGRDNKTTELTVATLKGAKYLILKLISVEEQNGFGTIQPALQTSADGDTWHDQAITGNWNQPKADDGQWDIDYSNEDIFYIVIDLTKLSFWNGFVTGSAEDEKAKILLNNKPGQIEVDNAYLADITITLTKPGTAFDLAIGGTTYGWAAKDSPLP